MATVNELASQAIQTLVDAYNSTTKFLINPVCNVMGFGCKADGITDDTNAIQSAINYVPAGGGIVYIPDGTYLVNPLTPIVPKNNVTVIMSRNAVLKAIPTSSDSYAVIKMADLTNVLISGGYIQGERGSHMGTTGEWGFGMEVDGCTDITIRDVKVSDCWGDGVYVGASLLNGESKNITLDNVVSTNNRRNGLSIVACKGALVNGGKFSLSNGLVGAEIGIDIEPNSPYVCEDILISAATCEQNNRSGILITQGTGSASKVKVLGCTSKNNKLHGVHAQNVSDIAVENNTIYSNAQHGVYMFTVSNSCITGNVVRGNTNQGIRTHSSSYQVTISGNVSESNGDAGIAVDTSSYECTVTGNVVKNNTGTGISSTGSNNVISDNVSSGNGDGIVAVMNYGAVNGNMCRLNKNYGIRLQDSSNNTVSGNTCLENSQAGNNWYDNIIVTGNSDKNNIQNNTCRKGAQANSPRYGIRVNSSTCDSNLVINNDLVDAGVTANYSDAGTGTVTTAGNRIA